MNLATALMTLTSIRRLLPCFRLS